MGFTRLFCYKNENQELFDCEEKPCAECLKCYTFPMDMVITKLRKLKGKK